MVFTQIPAMQQFRLKFYAASAKYIAVQYEKRK